MIETSPADGRDAARPKASRGRSALWFFAALVLVLALGDAAAHLVAAIGLEPRCEAYARAHAIDYDGVDLRHFKRRKIAVRLSPCLFSDRTPARAAVPVRWRELGDVPSVVRLGVQPIVTTLAFGAGAAGLWLMLSPAGIAYRRRISRGRAVK